jgi:competence ComEA-like helix-hairpin-helix protein
MFIGQDLLTLLLLSAALTWSVRAARPPAALGRAGPPRGCAVPVQRPGEGVVCLLPDDAVRKGVRAGQGMAPDRLAAWGVAVDVNGATVAELASLEGVGPQLAARIVAARPFASVEEVARVKGIGVRRLARLRPRLVLDEGWSDRLR